MGKDLSAATDDEPEEKEQKSSKKKAQPIPEEDELDSTYSKTEDVTSALTNLGYQKIEAYRVASEVCLKNPEADLGSLIRLALKEFNQ